MATKSRARAKGGAAPGAPKPKIEPRKTPLLRRRWVRWLALAVVAAAAIWIGLFMLGRASRAHALRTYETKLFNAGTPFFQDIQQSDTSMQQVVANFQQKKITAAALAAASAKWASDFETAGGAIANLKPPRELKDAQQMLLTAIGNYVTVARFYDAVQKQSDLAAKVPKANQKAATDQVTLLLQHIAEVQTIGDSLYTNAVTAINDLATKWGVKVKNPLPAAPQAIPSQ